MMRQNTKTAVKKLKRLILDPKDNVEDFRSRLEAEFADAMLPNRVEKEKRTIDGIDCAVFVPEVYASNRPMLYVHGGCFAAGSCASWANFCASLANISCTKLILPEIPLAPEHPYPAALETLKTVIKKLYTETDNIIIGADGSGALIAVSLVLTIKEKFRGKIKELILFSPWLDISADSETLKTLNKKNTDPVLSPANVRAAAQLYTYESNCTNPFVSPMFASPELLSGLPPVYMQMADDELLLKDAVCFQDKLRKADVPCTLDVWKDTLHLFQMADEVFPQAHLAMEKVGTHIKTKHSNGN